MSRRGLEWQEKLRFMHCMVIDDEEYTATLRTDIQQYKDIATAVRSVQTNILPT